MKKIKKKEEHYVNVQNGIEKATGGVGGKIGANKIRKSETLIRASRYVSARNERDERSQTREYDRSDLFEKKVGDQRFSIPDDITINQINDYAEKIIRGQSSPKRL